MKKGFPKNFIIIGAVVLILIILGSAIQNFLLRKAGEKAAESLIKARTGVEVDLDSGKESLKMVGKEGQVEIGNTTQWPSDMPLSVPKFPTGKIAIVTKANNNWSVIIKEVKKEDMEKYVSLLQQNGWQAENQVSLLVDLVQMEKETYRLTLAYDATSQGVSLTVSQKEN